MKYSIPLFIIPVIVWVILQFLKIIIDYYNWEKFWLERFFAAWWFPSVHSWLSTSLLVSIVYVYWFNWPYFAIVIVFSALFWYDAANVRYQAGKHAQIINKMRNQLSDIFTTSLTVQWERLKERLWHTFWEVVWWIFLSAFITLIVLRLCDFYNITIV